MMESFENLDNTTITHSGQVNMNNNQIVVPLDSNRGGMKQENHHQPVGV